MSDVTQRSIWGLVLFNVITSGTECTIIKFACDTNMSGAVNAAEGRDATQRDLNKFEKQPHELNEVQQV